MRPHVFVREAPPTLNAPLRCKAAVRLDDPVGGDPGCALKAVDVLGEELVQEVLLREERYEGVGDGRAEAARVELAREDVEGLRVVAEEGDVEDGFGVGEV